MNGLQIFWLSFGLALILLGYHMLMSGLEAWIGGKK